MPKFFFHLRDEIFLKDPDGTELPDPAAALASAKEDVRSLISERIRSGRVFGPAVMVIADETGVELASVSFKEVLSELAPWICE
ncbi:hypothetical protein ABID21_001751 [Pseudorhizobium tarimense]|uniref:DUF6894 domain-containing protein n=1 Tax=Pseudorhizobium tarimense TaxID=1079109 RepID=A0ABV2H512_9HYPH|nr:hypothetical protein [Pseudorhizobium tarimense]